MNIYNRVFSHIQDNDESIALQYRGKTMTYSLLKKTIQKVANIFRKEYMSEGDKVFLYLPNCLEFIICFFATAYLGGITVLADIKLNKEVLKMIQENNIKLIFTDHLGAEKIKKACESSQSEVEISLIYNLVIVDKEAIMDIALQDIADIETYPIQKLNAEAMVLYTSGSIGRPKGVINTHHTLIEALDNYTSTLPITKNDRLLAVTPFFHSYAFGSCMLAGLAMGATLIIKEEFQPRQILQSIIEDGVTIFHGVPYMYDMINKYYNSKHHSFENIQYFISAGAPLSETVAMEFFLKTNRIIHQEYGSTETGTIAINLSDNAELNIKSVGCPLVNVEIKIMEEQDGEGIICVKKTGCGSGYIGETSFEDEWYVTEDIGMLLPKGFIVITGRKNRMINIAGIKVNPDEIENCIRKIKGIQDVRVIGIEDKDFGQSVKALIIKNNMNVTEEMVITHCRKCLALYKVPTSIEWVNNLPKSALGKITSFE